MILSCSAKIGWRKNRLVPRDNFEVFLKRIRKIFCETTQGHGLVYVLIQKELLGLIVRQLTASSDLTPSPFSLLSLLGLTVQRYAQLAVWYMYILFFGDHITKHRPGSRFKQVWSKHYRQLRMSLRPRFKVWCTGNCWQVQPMAKRMFCFTATRLQKYR